MQKRRLSLVFTLIVLLVSVFQINSAQAAALAGKVGVGTWNTQAEFADVKVVKGTQTLYQSNFAEGSAEWTKSGGNWQTVDGVLRQSGSGTPANALVGESTWSDYTLTLRARKISGDEGFLITFASPDGSKSWWNIGGWGNSRHVLEVPGASAPDVAGSITTGQWYDIKVQLDGSYVRCYLDGALLVDTFPKPLSGKVGVGTWNTQAEFADVKVVKGTQTLYQSNFVNGFAEWSTPSGTWQTANGVLRQTGNATPATALVGESTWSDYTLTLRARKISGDEGFLISFATQDGSTSWWNIGGWGNTKHVVQAPGITAPEVAGSITTGQWYDIKIQLSGTEIRFYLNGALLVNTARLLDNTDRTNRFNQLINSPGFSLLNSREQAGLRDLAGRNVWIGAAARATFESVPDTQTYASLSAAQQALIIRKVNKNRMTWNRGWGFDGQTWRDGYITDNMDQAVMRYNSLGVFDKHLTANNSPGTPTADGGYDGQLRFGTQMTVRTCIHEINHALGVGTYWRWGQLMVDGWWTGTYGNRQRSEFDGVGSVIQAGDAYHFVNYGMNQDWEYSWENARRSILLVAAMRRDMGIADQVTWNYDFGVPSNVYSLVPRHGASKAISVRGSNGASGDAVNIATPSGGDNQKFTFELQPEGTYRIRTALTGNRILEIPGANVNNGTAITLADDNSAPGQRWFMIPTDDGWYKIAPMANNFKGADVAGGSTADGAVVQSWDYLDGFNQQWKLVTPEQIRSTTSLSDGTYTLTPRHATDKVLEVSGNSGANGDTIDIWTSNGGDNQKFLLTKQSDGSYRFLTKLAGNRAVALSGSVSENGTRILLADADSSAGQSWSLIPTDNGWFKIAPKNDLTKSIDIAGGSTANGARANNWNYFAANNQQWKLTRVDPSLVIAGKVTDAAGTALSGATVSNGSKSTTTSSDGTYAMTDMSPGDAVLTANKSGYQFAPQQLKIKITDNVTNANFTATQMVSSAVISEYRTGTTAAEGDEFVEIYNNSGAPLNVSNWSLSAGTSNPGAVVYTFPANTTIPVRGHYLVTGSAYSLANHGGTGNTAGDGTFTGDLPRTGGVALWNANGAVVDQVGTAASGLAEGGGVPAAPSTGEYSYVRRVPVSGTMGSPVDTNDNASDFIMVSTSFTTGTGTSRVGTPGPENLASPIQTNGIISAVTVVTNRVGSPTGTATLRRRLTNTSPNLTITNLRLRLTDGTTAGTASAGAADIRVIGGDGSTTNSAALPSGSAGFYPLVLSASPDQSTSGGGLNSVLELPSNATISIPPGKSIDVEFTVKLLAAGSYKAYFVYETKTK